MFEDYYMTVDEVAKALKVSKSFAYKVIRKMNAEMQELGFFTVAGKSRPKDRRLLRKNTLRKAGKTVPRNHNADW